jgi:hypothetical protein
MWLGGMHLNPRNPAPEYSHEEMSEAQLADELRSSESVKVALEKLLKSKNPWVRRAAELALTLHFKGKQLKEEAQLGVLEFELRPGGNAFIALMPTAVPNGEAENAVRFSVSAFGTGWKLPTHKAHLVVSLRPSVSASLSQTLSLFTSLLGAVTKNSNAVGVYWGDAGVTHDAKFLMSIAQE